MPKINVILVDDEKDALQALEILLHETQMVQVIKRIDDPLDVFPALLKDKPDAIFMDIRMPRIDGIELIKKVREINPTIPVIIVSAYDNHVFDAVKHQAFDYLLKPVNRKELSTTIDKLSKVINLKKDKTSEIIINTKTESRIVKIEDIVYLQADGNYTYIHTIDDEKIHASINMGKISDRIKVKEFYRINRSVTVNKEFLVSINKKNKTCTLRYKGKKKIFAVSLSFLKDFNMTINE